MISVTAFMITSSNTKSSSSILVINSLSSEINILLSKCSYDYHEIIITVTILSTACLWNLLILESTHTDNNPYYHYLLLGIPFLWLFLACFV